MSSSSFSVAGLAGSTNSRNNSNLGLSTWGTQSASANNGPSSLNASSSLADSLSQSRSQYQSGYLMSSHTNHNSNMSQSGMGSFGSSTTNNPGGNSANEANDSDSMMIVPTRAKLNNSLFRNGGSDFGKESMFQSSSRTRQTFDEEDAPPMASVNDMLNDVHYDAPPRFSQSSQSPLNASAFRSRPAPSQQPSASTPSRPPLYIVVFGYPADKYSVTQTYFKSFGDCTEAETNTNVINCFRLGYYDPADAMRALRKNGEVLGGSWMIGVKFEDESQAQQALGQRSMLLASRSTMPMEDGMDVEMTGSSAPPPPPQMQPQQNLTPVGTPMKLAPASSIFRKPGAAPTPATPTNNAQGAMASPASPNKGMMGHVSELIFGW